MGRLSDAMLEDDQYPLAPGWKEPTTSRAAAKAIETEARNLRELVLAVITESGMAGRTADEVAAKLNRSVLAIRPRLSELGPRRLAKIERTGERRTNLSSGLKAAVWRITRC